MARSASVWCIEWLGAKLDQHRPKGESHLGWKEPKVGQEMVPANSVLKICALEVRSVSLRKEWQGPEELGIEAVD